ncbi:SixA phosphatase family protein [Nocardioides speluncae]|uniref:SixA phosphatase family protein n=1 Tax=Nocardioides speluncae TaxID=2670337 RepID=UPI001F0CC551|nr:histidine phosphatase family protein [Nocardioides speluncae]
MPESPRTLVVMRHAKAEPFADTDHARVLSARGRADATAAGEWLADHDVVPDLALVSDAARTRQTWEAVSAAAGWLTEATYDQALYDAGPESTLDIIRLAPASAESVIFIGHNPTAAYLAQLLDDGEGSAAAIASISEGYPTSALTVFEYDGEWAALEHGTARVTGFYVGRG